MEDDVISDVIVLEVRWRVAARKPEAMNADVAGGAWGRMEAYLVLKFLGFVDLRS